MLDLLEIRLLSALLAGGAVLGLFLLLQMGPARARGPRDVRASVPMSRALEILWPAVANLPTVAVFAMGGILALSAVRHLGKHFVVQIVVAQEHRLVTSGPYARIRHPAYTAAILLSIGAGLFFLNLVFLVNLVIVAGLAVYRARLEERLLSSPQGFGLQYRAYVARTGRFFPRLR